MKRKLALIMAFIMAFPLAAYADNRMPDRDIIYMSADAEDEAATEGQYTTDSVDYADGVTDEMTKAEYWCGKSVENPDDVLMSHEQIKAYNQSAIDTKGTSVVDLKKIKTVSADSLKAALISGMPGSFRRSNGSERTIYANTVLISSNQIYLGRFADAIRDTAFTGNKIDVKYAVTVKRTDIRNVPTTDYIGYSATDSDNEIVLSSLNVNEPFVVRQKCEYDGQTFYYGNSDCVSGWVNGEDVAICTDYDEWVGAWEVDATKKDFIVVTQDKIVLEKSYYSPYSSELKLTLGTVLKEVPENEIPRSIAERGPWNNYVVYVPTRTDDGSYEAKMALIAQNNKISEGYLPLTKRNVLEITMSCLGNRYGWGGMLDALDCSAYTRTVYRCFGLIMPRNTSWQPLVSGTAFDIKAMTDAEKINALRRVPAGSLLYFPGHTMIYLGIVDGRPFAISATGSLSDSAGETGAAADVRSMNSVIITPLDVRRGASSSYTTWLRNLTTIVCVQGVNKYEITGDPTDDPTDDPKYPEISLKVGETKSIAGDIGATGKMKYVVSDTAVATVNSKGVIKAKNNTGSVSVTGYTRSGKKWVMTGKITAEVVAPKFEKTIYLTEGDSVCLEDYMTDCDRTCVELVTATKPSVADCVRENLTLTAVKAGTCKLRIKVFGRTTVVKVIVQK